MCISIYRRLCMCVCACLKRVCLCVCEIERDRQISVGDSHRRAASSPLTESPLRDQSPFGGVMRLPPHFHFVWEGRVGYCVSVCVCVCVCGCMCVCDENVMWDNASAGIFS